MKVSALAAGDYIRVGLDQYRAPRVLVQGGIQHLCEAVGIIALSTKDGFVPVGLIDDKHSLRHTFRNTLPSVVVLRNTCSSPRLDQGGSSSLLKRRATRRDESFQPRS